MAPKVPPLTLNKVALTAARSLIVQAVENHLRQCDRHRAPPRDQRQRRNQQCEELVDVANYLKENTTAALRDDIVNSVLLRTDLTISIRNYIFRLLVSGSTVRLDVSQMSQCQLGLVLQKLATLGEDSEPKLQTLITQWNESSKIQHQYLLSALRVVGSRLCHLCLTAIGTNYVLEVVGKSCPVLEHLDVGYSRYVSYRGVSKLCRLGWTEEADEETLEPTPCSQTLRVVGVYCCGRDSHMTAKTMAYIINNLPNLTQLLSYEKIGTAVRIAASSNPGLVTMLTHAESHYPDGPRIECLASHCPALTTLKLSSPRGAAFEKLGLLQKLVSLTVWNFRWDAIVKYLKTYGTRLRMLSLSKGLGTYAKGQDTDIDVADLANWCPRLESLILDEVGDLILTEPTVLPELLQLEISKCKVKKLKFSTLISCCPSLEELSVSDEVKSLCPVSLGTLLYGGRLDCIKYLWLGDVPRLTAATAKAIIERCPRLRTLGHLSGWKMNAGEARELSQFIRENNYEVRLMQCIYDDGSALI